MANPDEIDNWLSLGAVVVSIGIAIDSYLARAKDRELQVADFWFRECLFPNAGKSLEDFSSKYCEYDGGRYSNVNLAQFSDDLSKLRRKFDSIMVVAPAFYQNAMDLFDTLEDNVMAFAEFGQKPGYRIRFRELVGLDPDENSFFNFYQGLLRVLVEIHSSTLTERSGKKLSLRKRFLRKLGKE